jgi:hypothetical protein
MTLAQTVPARERLMVSLFRPAAPRIHAGDGRTK